MNRITSILAILLVLSVLASCSIEKRIHNKGVHITWKKKYTSKSTALVQDASLEKIRVEEGREAFSMPTGFVESVQKIDSKNVRTKKKKREETPVQQTSRTDKPSRTLFSHQKHELTNSQLTTKVNQGAEQKETKAAGAAKGGKSQVVALILVICVGVLGVHRFYLGYTGIGVLMILTVGCCGILALIDLIRIATGDLKPKNEEYSETL